MCGFSLAAIATVWLLSVSSMATVRDFALWGPVGQSGRRAQQQLITVGLRGFFLSSCRQREQTSYSLIIFLCYFHIYFQQIEMELRQMELIKDQYQKKNYEQVDDFHKRCVYHSRKIPNLDRFTDCLPLCALPVPEYPEICV